MAKEDPAAAAEATKKLTAMASEFSSKSSNMLKDMQNNFNTTVDAAVKNFVALQSSYLTGYEDMTKQSKKANEDMLKNLGDNMKNLKGGLQSSYDTMTKTLNEGYDKALATFKSQTEETLKKNPALPPAPLKDAISYLNNNHKQVLDSNAKRLKGIMDNLDKRYKVLVDQVTIPPLTVPKLSPPVIKTFSGGTPSSSGCEDCGSPSKMASAITAGIKIIEDIKAAAGPGPSQNKK